MSLTASAALILVGASGVFASNRRTGGSASRRDVLPAESLQRLVDLIATGRDELIEQAYELMTAMDIEYGDFIGVVKAPPPRTTIYPRYGTLLSSVVLEAMRRGIERGGPVDLLGLGLGTFKLPGGRRLVVGARKSGAPYAMPANLLAGKRLVGWDFDRGPLLDVDLSGATLVDCSFVGTVLVRPYLEGTKFERPDFTAAALWGPSPLVRRETGVGRLRMTHLSGGVLEHAGLMNVDLDRAILPGANCRSVKMMWSSLTDCDFSGADFSWSPYSPALPPHWPSDRQHRWLALGSDENQGPALLGHPAPHFWAKNLTSLSRGKSWLEDGVFSHPTEELARPEQGLVVDRCQFRNADFARAHLKMSASDCDFDGANFHAPDGAYRGPDEALQGVVRGKYRKCSWRNARFDTTRVWYATFLNCSFAGSSMKQTDIRAARFRKCDLSNVHLFQATFGGDVHFVNCTVDKLSLAVFRLLKGGHRQQAVELLASLGFAFTPPRAHLPHFRNCTEAS